MKERDRKPLTVKGRGGTIVDDSGDEYGNSGSRKGGRRIAREPVEKIGIPRSASEVLALAGERQLMVEEEAWPGALLKHQIKINNKIFQNPSSTPMAQVPANKKNIKNK